MLLSTCLTILSLTGCSLASALCKTIPSDANWPSHQDWQTLNASIGGVLIKTAPAGSACYPGNPFNSQVLCNVTQSQWTSYNFHAEQPESVDYPLFANNTCIPPGQTGYVNGSACTIGALPAYIVNATDGHAVATAIGWAADRNIRVVIKGTGHEYNGRSTGAHSLSIWTHHLKNISFISWHGSESAVVLGSGWRYGDAYDAVYAHGRALSGGGDRSVGLGGHIQGGGHGPFSSHYGLAADNIFQVTVATTEGKLIVANETQHEDLLFAVRGGGGGQYGVVTEYVLKLHPRPINAFTGQLSMYANSSAAENNTWRALAAIVSELPSLMDDGITGSAFVADGPAALAFLPSLQSPPTGAAFTAQFIAFNTSGHNMDAQLRSFISRISQVYGNDSAITFSWSGATLSNATFPSSVPSGVPSIAGGGNVMSSRLLGRKELSIPPKALQENLRNILYSPTNSGLVIIGLQGGKGVMNVAEHMRGAVNPVWRSTYLHVMAYTVPLDTTISPKMALAKAGEWAELNVEKVWREWAPFTGAYMNEGNPFNSNWKHDFYGVHYNRLMDVKRKYDPSDSLFVLTGVGSDRWDYDLDSGRLCRLW
ncbi:FAD-binding domain-containing protein, partial [Aureobasidium melanogenum]